MIVDQTLLLGQFAKRRNAPVKYDRVLVEQTMRAMERIEEIRARRERVFVRRRLRGKEVRAMRKRADARVVVEGEHLIAKEMGVLEEAREAGKVVVDVQKEVLPAQVVGAERLRMKRKRKLLVGGGEVEEMDVD